MSSRINPSDVDIRQRQANDAEFRRSRSTGTTPRSSTRGTRQHGATLYAAKDVTDVSNHRKVVDDNSSSDEEDDRCRIIPATNYDDDYLERLDRKVSEVINRSRLGNFPAELSRSNSEHYGPLSMNYTARNFSKKSSPGSAHRISRTPRTSESTAVHSSSTTPSTTATPRPLEDVNVRFVDNNDDDASDSSDTLESSPEDFNDVAKMPGSMKLDRRWSDVEDDEANGVGEESAEGDDEGNDGVVLRRRR